MSIYVHILSSIHIYMLRIVTSSHENVHHGFNMWAKRSSKEKKMHINRNFGIVGLSMLENIVPSSTMDVRWRVIHGSRWIYVLIEDG